MTQNVWPLLLPPLTFPSALASTAEFCFLFLWFPLFTTTRLMAYIRTCAIKTLHTYFVPTYLPQVPALAVLHSQKRKAIGGHEILHSVRNLSCCDYIHMIQPDKNHQSITKCMLYISAKINNTWCCFRATHVIY